MSTHFPVCSGKDVVRVLQQNSFLYIDQRGSHQKWRHPDGRQVIVPMHGNKPIPIGTLRNIVKGSALAVEDFR